LPQHPGAEFFIEFGCACLGCLRALSLHIQLGHLSLRRLRALPHHIQLGHLSLHRLRPLSHLMDPRLRLPPVVLALAAKLSELDAKSLKHLSVLAQLVAQPLVLFRQSVLVHRQHPSFPRTRLADPRSISLSSPDFPPRDEMRAAPGRGPCAPGPAALGGSCDRKARPNEQPSGG
jgi:hypothetical protein